MYVRTEGSSAATTLSASWDLSLQYPPKHNVEGEVRAGARFPREYREFLRHAGFYAAFTLVLAIACPTVFGQSEHTVLRRSIPSRVPRIVKFGSQLKDSSGHPLNNTVGVIFAIYGEPTGGAPLWQETQNVQFSQGNYSVLLGDSTGTGVPTELFASGEPRWLGITALLPGEQEQPRVLLASVPYALKALDADTLGGLPASAFLRANTNSCGATVPSSTVAVNSGNSGMGSPTSPAVFPGIHPPPLVAGQETGHISIVDSTNASYTFVTKWISRPVCTLTPLSDPHALGGYWVSSTIVNLTASVHYSGRITFAFNCQGRYR